MISIIVPVYNAEKTLRQCVDSILAQDFMDYELILVDDGSKDSSPSMCDEFANKDTRVIVIHKSNAGVSSARNKGLEIAHGEWICFIDSDDYIADGFFHGVASCKQQLLVTGFRDEVHGIIHENVKLTSAIYQNAEDVSQFIRRQVTSNMVLRGPWGKFYRRELLEDQCFNTEMKLGEDTCFVLDYLAKCHSIEVNASSFYVIRRGAVPDAIKYQSSVDYAVRSLSFVWESFKRMDNVHQIGHSCFNTFLGYYKLMCKHEWKHHLSSWYCNPQVYKMYQYVFQGKLSLIIIKYRLIRYLSLVLDSFI